MEAAPETNLTFFQVLLVHFCAFFGLVLIPSEQDSVTSDKGDILTDVNDVEAGDLVVVPSASSSDNCFCCCRCLCCPCLLICGPRDRENGLATDRRIVRDSIYDSATCCYACCSPLCSSFLQGFLQVLREHWPMLLLTLITFVSCVTLLALHKETIAAWISSVSGGVGGLFLLITKFVPNVIQTYNNMRNIHADPWNVQNWQVFSPVQFPYWVQNVIDFFRPAHVPDFSPLPSDEDVSAGEIVQVSSSSEEYHSMNSVD
jgi:hypothetical protein